MRINNQGNGKTITDKDGFGLPEALHILKVKPSTEELERLAKFYHRYELPKRKGILWGYFEGQNTEELLTGKFESENIDSKTLSKQAKGGHTKWLGSKIKDIVIRILYLRYVHDKNLSRIAANQKIFKKITNTSLVPAHKKNGEIKSKESLQSMIRKITQIKEDKKDPPAKKSPVTKKRKKPIKPHWSW